MHHASFKSVVGLAAASTVLFAGCDQLTATTQAVSVITSTPSLDQAEGIDTDLLAVLPAGELPLQATAVLVGLGERDSITSTEAPTGVADAVVSVNFGSGPINLCGVEGGDGTYQTTSVPTEECGDDSLEYEVGAEYKTTIETSTDTFELSVVAPAPVDPEAVTFSPALGDDELEFDDVTYTLKIHAKNTALTLDWSADAEASSRNALVTLVRINRDDVGEAWELDPQNPIFDNAPREPAGLIDLITKTPPKSVTIEASAFDTEGLYMVVVTSTELSTDTSSNLSVGSGALAGRGTAFVFYVQ